MVIKTNLIYFDVKGAKGIYELRFAFIRASFLTLVKLDHYIKTR